MPAETRHDLTTTDTTPHRDTWPGSLAVVAPDARERAGTGARRVDRPGAAEGVQSWDDLVDTLRTGNESAVRLDGIDLTRDDLALLEAHLGLLGLIQVVPGTRGSGHTVTVAVCDACGQWMLSTGAVPRRCRLTNGARARW